MKSNILILTQWSFKDALVQTYTLPYVDIIRKLVLSNNEIFLLTAEQGKIALRAEEKEQINVEWRHRNMILITQTYRRFGLLKMISAIHDLYKLYRLIKKKNIGTIHAFCTPAGSLAYLLCKLSGARLIIDSYEPHAESMVENRTWKKNSLAFRILFWLEKKMTGCAYVLIATTEGMRQYALDRFGIRVKNFFVKPACVDLNKFYPREKKADLLKELNLENKIVCVYAGKLGGIYYKEEVFDFIKNCYDHWKDDFRFLLLTNATREEIDAHVQRTGLPDAVVVNRYVYHQDIPAYLSLGDFAINPVKPVPTKRYCTSIKDGEYWAMGLPVVISPGISDDSEIIETHSIGVVHDLRTHENHPSTIHRIHELLHGESREQLQQRIFAIAKQYRSFEIARQIYPQIYENQ